VAASPRRLPRRRRPNPPSIFPPTKATADRADPPYRGPTACRTKSPSSANSSPKTPPPPRNNSPPASAAGTPNARSRSKESSRHCAGWGRCEIASQTQVSPIQILPIIRFRLVSQTCNRPQKRNLPQLRKARRTERAWEKVKKLEKEVASLSKKIEAPKDWRLMVGRLADTRIAREADALGREIRRKQTDL